MRNVALIVFILSGIIGKAQSDKPKLVVGIVVDQMRYQYLYKYQTKYGEGGFKRLMNQGTNCKNMHYNYVPTYTGPGHASIYAGTTPSTHGIIGNSWYDKSTGNSKYCVDDETVKIVGTEQGIGKSPANLLTTNIADELRLAHNKRSKVVSISLKDRGAVLPAGHMANGAYWFNSATGTWVSSEHYMRQLPEWVVKFNESKRTEHFLSQPWKTVIDLSFYQESAQDNNAYEGLFPTESTPTFPHDLPAIFKESQNFGIIKSTPFGNTITSELAIEAIKNEGLGKDDYPDLLAVSFSSPDYVGHMFGPQSVELEDTYIRLDKELEKLLKTLDAEVGEGEYVVFLTADHGAVRVPQFLMDNKIPAGYFDAENLVTEANTYLANFYGEGEWVTTFKNYQFYLNEELMFEKKLNRIDVEKTLVDFSLTVEGIAAAFTSEQLTAGEGNKHLSLLQKGYHQKISGNVAVSLLPGWITYHHTGTTHGSYYSYDTHVPMLWMGKDIPQQKLTREVVIPDIAATISMLLDISLPSGATGSPIVEVLD